MRISMKPGSHILLVEDDHAIARLLQLELEHRGYVVRCVFDGAAALPAVEEFNPDAIILDIMLPGMDGERILHALRRGGNRAPIVMLTARDRAHDKVRSLDIGADDYVTKPFGVLELLARVEALLRRTARVPAHETNGFKRFADVEVDPSSRTVTRAGEPVSLTPMELDLLLALIDRGGAVASRPDLMREVWGHRAVVVSRTVDTHVAELRRKLEPDPAVPRHILTVRKAGYRFRGEE
jgi:DNA-binding response OmpR family regulator